MSKKIDFFGLSILATLAYALGQPEVGDLARKKAGTGPNPNNEEEKFAEFLNGAILPRKSALYTPPDPRSDLSDLVRSREDPIILSPQVEHIARDFYTGRKQTEGLTDTVNRLDLYWARERAATLVALELIERYHRHHETTDHIVSYADYLAGRYIMYRRIVDHMKGVIPNLKGKRVIEVGGGSGISLTMLAKEGAEVHNLDISEMALRFFELLATHYGVSDSIHTIRADFFDTRLDSNMFDLTFNVGVYEHLTPNERARLLEEQIRITAPGGIVMASVPNSKSPNYHLMEEKLKEILKEDMKFPMPKYEYVDPVELLKSGGLEPLKDGTYAQGYTQIAPPVKIKPRVIKPEDFAFFRDLPAGPESKMHQLLNAWYILEKTAPPRILERYAMFTHAFGRKPG